MFRDGDSILIAAIALMGVSGLLDFLIRMRLWRAGEKRVFRKRGGFDYRGYRREAIQRGWPVWPVYAMAVTLALGIVLFWVGLFVIFGSSRPRAN
jgi:hypothetical protein